VNATPTLEADSRPRATDGRLGQPVKVLCVDDLPGNLLAREATLAGMRLELVKARSGQEALRCLLEEDFALILLDVKMPGMDGFETAELIRQRPRCQHTPIIFLTASDANAGHVPGYILSAFGEVKAVLKATALPLAVLPDGDFPAAVAPPLEPGELLLLLTDGILEAHGPGRKLFGIERVFEVVRRHQAEAAREIVDRLYAAVRAFSGAEAQLDDMTASVIKAAPVAA
jgi:CheY-like chemotaxis protein